MTEDYCKLVSGIILSTIWREDDHTRILWITMLAVKSRNHEVLASVPGLAAVANIPIEACRKSLHKLMQPDPDSRTKDHEGRRIAEIDGGWVVLNGEKYRNFLSKQERNEYQAKLMAARRENEKLAGVSKKLAVLAHTEAEAEAEADTIKARDASLSFAGQIKEIFESWNQTAKLYNLKQCLVVSDKRRRSIEARLRDSFFVASWKSALEKVVASDFCKGTNERGWTASFDWFIQPDSIAKLLEGKYDNRNKTHQRVNPRLEGVSRNPINDYAAGAKRLLERQEREELVRQMAKVANGASPEANGA